MTEFVGHAIGTRHYSYPETPRGAGALAFARNFAIGPAGEATAITGPPGTQVPWGTVAVPGSNIQDVPITPRVTGYLRISGIFTVVNASGSTKTVSVQLQINNVTQTVPLAPAVTLENNEEVIVPFLAETTPSDTPVGTLKTIQILLTSTSDSLVLLQQSSIVDVQEVGVPTG